MKGVLFLSLVGAAIYMALVVSHDQLPTDRADDSLLGKALAVHPIGSCVRGALTFLP